MPHHTRNDTYSVLSIGLSGRTSADFPAEELPADRVSRHLHQSIFPDCETSHPSTSHALKGKIAIFLLFKTGKVNMYNSPSQVNEGVCSHAALHCCCSGKTSLSSTLGVMASLGPQVSHWELHVLGVEGSN